MSTKMVAKVRNLLTEYDHANTEEGVGTIENNWRNAKRGLISMLSNHPNWDAENYRIVFDSDYVRDFDRTAVKDFKNWMLTQFFTKMLKPILVNGKPINEVQEELQEMRCIQSRIEYIRSACQENADMDSSIIFTYKGEEYSTLRNLIASLTTQCVQSRFTKTHCGVEYILCEEDSVTVSKISTWMNYLESAETNILDAETVGKLNEIFPDLRIGVGLKITKAIQKLCKKFGFDKVVEMRNQLWIDQDGMSHSREKDFGYNYQIAQLGDRINPLTIKRHTIISVNLPDYLTMSFGHGWASCHTIDKSNKRGARGNHYSGCYCSGTLSYALDDSSIIFYTVDADYNGNAYETQDKMQRCMFHINLDGTVIIQGRVYPDGRDGGDRSFASQFRAVMQKVIADCTHNNNMWVVKKGTEEICNYEESDGTNYRDYEEYNDCTVSLLKGIEGYQTVYIGTDPICPNCGEKHEEQEYLCCEDCNGNDTVYCEICGCCIHTNSDDYEFCDDNDCYYCCSSCAEADDLHFAADYYGSYEWRTEYNCWQDDYSGNWYSCNPAVVTEDGHRYRSEHNAEQDGYMLDCDGNWYPEDEFYEDDYTGEMFHPDSDSVETSDGNHYMDTANAEADGYRYVDGEWVKAEEEEDVA